MGVIFLKSESRQFISDCQSNIQNGQDVIQDLKSGCAHLMQAIDGKTLSGAAYTAGKGLFGDLINPVITRFGQAIEEMQADLRRYSSADQAIQAASTNKLDEDKLIQQIRECEAYRHTVKLTADALNSQAFEILAMSNPVTAMVALADQLFNIRGNLNAYLTSLDQDIDKLKNDLRLLQNFVSQTQGLFRDSTSRIKLAMQGISVLGKMKVNADGRYRFPKGMDERWFNEIQKAKSSKEKYEKTLPKGHIISNAFDAIKNLFGKNEISFEIPNKKDYGSTYVKTSTKLVKEGKGIIKGNFTEGMFSGLAIDLGILNFDLDFYDLNLSGSSEIKFGDTKLGTSTSLGTKGLNVSAGAGDTNNRTDYGFATSADWANGLISLYGKNTTSKVSGDFKTATSVEVGKKYLKGDQAVVVGIVLFAAIAVTATAPFSLAGGAVLATGSLLSLTISENEDKERE